MEQTKKEQLVQKIIASVNENGAFARAFVAAENVADLQKVLSDNGFTVSAEDIEAMFHEGVNEILVANNPDDDGEISEDQLDDVSGGGFFRGSCRLLVSGAAAFGYGCLCGICPAASCAAPYIVGGLTVWTTAGYLKKGW